MTALLTVFPKGPAWFCCRDWKCATPGASVRPISPEVHSSNRPTQNLSTQNSSMYTPENKHETSEWYGTWHPRLDLGSLLLLWSYYEVSSQPVSPTIVNFQWSHSTHYHSRWQFFLGACSRPRGKIFTTAMQGAGIIHNNLGACWAANGAPSLSNAFCLREWKGSLLLE